MNFTKEEVTEFIELLKDAGEYKPLVKIMLDIIESYGSEFRRLPDAFIAYANEKQAETFHYFIDAGLTRQEALILTVDARAALSNIIKDFDKNKKGK
jgi:hypothetical protein